jgi:signal transduction histidine kinase
VQEDFVATPSTTPDSARSRLSDFLRAHQADIIGVWVERARSQTPAAALSDEAIVAHLPKMLPRLAEIVASADTATLASLGTLPKDHAADRLARGFDLDHIVTEYSLLRRAIMDLWEARVGATIDIGELRSLDAAFDESIRQSAIRYAEAREKLLNATDRVSEAALGSGDVDTVLADLLRATLDAMESVDTAVVLLREGDTLRVRAAVGLEEDLRRIFPMKIGEGFAGHVAAAGQPVLVREAATDPLINSEVIRRKGVRALYGVPLFRDGKVIGVAHIGSLRAFEFSEEDKLLFRTMASRATSVVVKAQLVADLRRTESAQRFLSEASKEFARSLDYEATLKTIAQLAVPTIADWCVVDLVENGAVRRVSVAHVDPQKQQLATELQERYPPDPKAATGIRKVLQTGRSELHTEISDAELVAASRDAEHLRLLRELGFHAYIIVPIVSRDQILGTIALVSAESNRRYSDEDLLIAQDLAGRAATSIENARLYADAQKAVQQREQVLAIVSHDLRNQLGVIVMGSQLLGLQVSELGTEAEALKPVEMIQRTARTMETLLGDLLDMASIQAGRLSIDARPENIKSLLVEACDGQQVLARVKGIDLACEQTVDDVKVRCDRDRIMQVLANLLGNAIKFCKAGDAIALRAEARDQDVLVAVRDNGPGIPHDEFDAIFEPYQTMKRPGQDGTGLGLYITKGIIQGHGGRVWVESAVGQGTTFFFTLPRA